MTIALTTTFNPRGETNRLLRLYPELAAAYDQIVVVLPPFADEADVMAIRALPGCTVVVDETWASGRYTSLKRVLATDATHIHYADMDRLLRWVETRRDEWLRTVEQVQRCECLVIGRTPAAWATHPQAMIQTEAIPNQLFSHLLGQELDLSAGSKGFSRDVLAFIVANSQPERPMGTDAEWIVLAQRGGFSIEAALVDGLDWEIPDQHQEQAADAARQQLVREHYDADASKWAHRVRVAQEIVAAGMDALVRRLIERS